MGLRSILQKWLIPERRSDSSTGRYWGWDLVDCGRSASGRSVATQEQALALSSVWAAVSIISGAIGYLPLKVYRRSKDGKELDAQNPVGELLKRPNPAMCGLTFRETLQAHALLRGNGYAEIQRDSEGQPVALWVLPPSMVTPLLLNTGDVGYVVEVTGQEKRRLSSRDMLHIKGLGESGYAGYSVIGLARESLGLGLAAEEFGARFFGNGARAGGVLQHPGKLTDESHKHLRDSWAQIHEGLSNAHRIAILEEGMVFKEMSVAPNDAQFLETRAFQREEIANWFQIPVHMLNGQNKPTFASVEQTGIEFQQLTMNRWEKRWENEVNFKLLSAPAFAEFLTAALLRGETKSRYEAYGLGIQSGWLTRNEVREAENLNRLEGLDDPLQPLNMAPAGSKPADADAEDDPEDDKAAPARFLPLFADIARRTVTREVKALRMDRKQPEDFWRRHQEFLTDALTPALLAAGREPDTAGTLARRHIEERRAALAGCNGNLPLVLDAWEAGAGRLADEWHREKKETGSDD